MSTYTDLHNRVKENINVDYNNRITTQRVRLFNEQNEFWGTLRGNVSAENINIQGGTLSGVTLTDTVLKGSVALPDGIDLHKVLQQVKQISVDLIQTTENLDQEVIDRKDAVEVEKDARVLAINFEASERLRKDQGLSTSIDQTNKDLVREISALDWKLTHQDYDISTELSTMMYQRDTSETGARIANDASLSVSIDHLSDVADFLSDKIVLARADFGREVFDRTVADSKLQLSIDNETAKSIKRDEELSLALSAHIVDNDKTFNELHLNMLSTIEHERHYIINSGTSTTKTTDTWPYSSKDYAVNIYNPTLNNGAVYYKDADDKRYEIGQIYEINPGSLYPFNFKTLKGIEHHGVASALVDNWTYGFDTDKKAQRTLLNGYTISFDDTKTTHVLSDYSFTVAPTLPQFHKVMYSGLMIGKVVNPFPEDYCDDLTSGDIYIDTMDSELETFNKFRKVTFNKTDLSTCSKQTERITYLGENKFRFEKNIDRAEYIPLIDTLEGSHNEFGRIYSSYNNITGIISDDNGIKDINVRLDKPYNRIVSLHRDTGFTTLVEEDVKFGDIYYNTVLSAKVVKDEDTEETTGIFDEVKVSELYKYDFTSIDEEGKTVIGGYIVPRSFNKTIIQSLDFTDVDVNITDVMWIDAFKKTYTLTKTLEDSLWSAEDTDSQKNSLNIKFNGTTIFIKVTSGVDGSIIRQELQVKVDEPVIYNPTTCHTHVYTTDSVSLDEYSDVYESPEATYDIVVYNDVVSESFPRYELGIDTSFVGALKILIPERTTTDISREFIVSIYPDSYSDQLVQLMFVNADGSEAKIVCKRRTKLLIPTNKWTTIQVKEINNNIFYVYDIDANELDHDIEFLSNAIDTEEFNRIANDKYLSDELNLSVVSLQNQVLSNDADISDIYEKIKGGINYKGIIYGELRDSSQNIVQIPTIHNLFVWPKHHYAINNYTEDTVLSNGFMFIMKELSGSTKSKFIIEGVDIEARDYVIINCRSEDPTCNGKAIRDLTSADVDIIDAEDSDVIHRPELDGISSFLSAEIKANDRDIEFLSNEVSTYEWNVFSRINYLSNCADYISAEVSANDNDIEYLSGNVKFLLSVDKETMDYKGTLPYLPNLSNDITHEDLGYNYLSTFILQNLGIHKDQKLKLGDFFRLSAVQSCLYDAHHTACWFGAKDYFVINKDVMVSDIVEADLDLFRNAETEFGWLSAALCAEIDALSTSLSDTTRISVENLQTQITGNDNDIKFLSDEIDRLSTEISNDIDALSTSLSDTTRLSVEELQRQVISNDNDIEFLSNAVSSEEQRTLKSIIYFGDVLLSDQYKDFESEAIIDNSLLGLLHTNAIADKRERKIRTGFTFHTSGNELSIFEIKDLAGGSRQLHNNEYITITHDITLNDIAISDIVVINDYDLSTLNLQNQIIDNDKDIKFLSGSIDYVSAEVSANDNDIHFLSTEADRLSTELSNRIDDLSTSLSNITKLSVENLQDQITGNDNDIEYISSEVSSNDNDIEFLSNDLSTLEYQHYNKTLSNDIELAHTYEDVEHHKHVITQLVDQLVIIDEVTFDRYRLTIRNGSLNINKIDNIVPTV